MKLERFCAILSLKPVGTLVIEAWIGLQMSLLVPFCIWLYYGGKVATVVFVGVQLIFWSSIGAT